MTKKHMLQRVASAIGIATDPDACECVESAILEVCEGLTGQARREARREAIRVMDSVIARQYARKYRARWERVCTLARRAA